MNTKNVVQFIKFCAVGGSGVVINMSIFVLLNTLPKFDFRISAIIAIEFAIINNFLWNNNWTFKDVSHKNSNELFRRFIKFNLTSGTSAMVINIGLDIVLAKYTNINIKFIHLFGIAVGTIVNYTISQKWIFSQPNKNDNNDN